LEEGKRSLEKILIVLNKIETTIKDQKIFPYQKEMEIKEIDEVKNKFLKAMDDDFNTPVGLACLFELVSMINKRIKDIDFVLQAKRLLLELADILGLTLKLEKPKISEEEIELWIKRRDLARKQRDFKLADRIRRDLETKGVILEDEKDKTVWRRKIR
jgi:cysteinyl-tRNA synthetase